MQRRTATRQPPKATCRRQLNLGQLETLDRFDTLDRLTRWVGSESGFSLRALIGLRRGDRDLHADSMFLAFILLEAAPIYRIVMFVFARLGGQVLAPNGEPVDAGALLRTVIVLAVLALGFWSCHRLRRNLLPMGIIAGVLVGALAFLPWSLDGAPA